MGNVKKRFVVDLTLNTKDVEKQLKATAGNIKTILADMGKASDKMGYFKELVDYIKQIDNAMTALKNKDPMKFNDLFDGLDTDLKQTFESLFGMASKDMSVLDELRSKLKSLDSGKAGVGELRNMAQEINSLFITLGKAPPFDINEHFKGSGDSVARIKMLTDQVENFATMWAGVNQKIQQGFGGSGTGIGSGSGVGGDLSQEVQQQIDALEEQINQYQLLLSKLNEINKMKSTLDNGKNIQLDFEATEESARELVTRFTQMYDALQDMDKESTEYAASLAECAKVALQLDQLNTNLTKKDKLGNVVKSSPKFLRDFIDGDSAAYVLEDFEFEFKDIQKIVQNAISDAKHQIEQLKIDASKIVPKGQAGTGSGTGTGGKGSGGTGTGNGASTSVTVDGPIDVDFTSLENTIKSEMASINAKLDDVLKVELVKDDTKDISGAIESIKANVDQISDLVKSYKTSKANTAAQTEVDNMKNNLSQFLKVVSEFNDRKTLHGQYQHQEIGAAILSDGSISAGYGEHGTVPWDRMVNSLLGNLTKSLLVDVHSHPWAEFYNGKKFANDSFSGSSGDLSAFRRSKELGAQMAAMITGNIMRTLDLSKLTDVQMKQFRSALSSIEKQYANTPEYSQYMEYDSQADKLYYKKQANIAEQHKVTEAFESLMYKAFEQIGFSKNRVDQEIFKKYNLTDDAQLTELAERLVQLSHASQDALSPVERLSQIVSQFGGDVNTEMAKAALKAYEKGERSAADVFNLLNTRGYTVNQDTIDSLMRIDSTSELPVVESLLTKISSVLDAISANIINIESNTRPTTDEQINRTISDLISLSQGNTKNKYLTTGVPSIFDPTNISEFKNREVLSYADSAVTDFNDALSNLFKKASYMNFDFESLDINEINDVLQKFAIAMSGIQDAQRQISLYEDRTGKFVNDGGIYASESLSNLHDNLTQQSTFDQLLQLLTQAKNSINKQKNYHSDGFEMSDSYDSTYNNQNYNFSSDDSINTELNKLTMLELAVDKVRNAIDRKTQAFRDEEEIVEFSVDMEVSALDKLANKLLEIVGILGIINTNFTTISDGVSQLNAIQNLDTDRIAPENTSDTVQTAVDHGYALDSTLLTTNSILTQILTSMGNNESIDQLIEPLKKAVLELKTVASGIVQYQKTQQPKLLAAKDRIASDYEGISNRAKNTVANLGDEVKIKQLSALENGIVRVEGATRDANGVWKGFVVDIDEANNTTIKAINEQSKFATSLNKSAEEAARLKQEVQDVFNKNKLIQTDAFEEYKRDLEASGNLTDELRIKLDALENQLKQIGDSTGLEIWQNQFATFQKTADKTAEVLTQQRIGAANQFKKDLNVDLGKLDFQIDNDNLTLEQERIAQSYREASDELEEYITNVKLGNKVEITGIEQKIIALKAQTKAYRDAHNIANARGGKAKAYGSKEVSNATTQFSGLTNRVNADFVDNAAIKTQLQALEASYNNLITLQKQFKVGEVISDQQEQDFKIALKQYQDLEKGLNKLINTYTKFKGAAAIKDVSGSFVNTEEGRKTELNKQIADYAKSFANSKVTVGKFKDDYNTLLFTIDKGNGIIDQMKASFDEAKQSIVITSKSAAESTSWLSRTWDDLKAKTLSLAKYYASSFGIQEVIQIIRQGITYVREIDSALTELKKVTSETDATYDAFLQTMSKTAGTIGSTTSELTTMAAEWARLGYSIEEAGKLAESTAILLNVSEFTDATQASEALISTMQAFQYTADESQHVVDILNEVGNNYAVSSDGIATALQDSASALMEGGNNLEQAVALVASANRVVQDPNSVGSALRTISLRLRGTSVEVLEEMGEETDGVVTSISKLQSKIKALSGVDILTDSGEYKDTYTILKEIGTVWEDMSDIDQAECCLCVQKCA